MPDKKKNKMVLVKVNDVKEAELDATIDRALDALFGEAKPIETVPPKDTKSVEENQKSNKTTAEKNND